VCRQAIETVLDAHDRHGERQLLLTLHALCCAVPRVDKATLEHRLDGFLPPVFEVRDTAGAPCRAVSCARLTSPPQSCMSRRCR
jgi:hypothetical protein